MTEHRLCHIHTARERHQIEGHDQGGGLSIGLGPITMQCRQSVWPQQLRPSMYLCILYAHDAHKRTMQYWPAAHGLGWCWLMRLVLRVFSPSMLVECGVVDGSSIGQPLSLSLSRSRISQTSLDPS